MEETDRARIGVLEFRWRAAYGRVLRDADEIVGLDVNDGRALRDDRRFLRLGATDETGQRERGDEEQGGSLHR